VAFSQDDAGFTADRPGATTSPDVLPKGRLQWETGVAWERDRIGDPATTAWTPNTSMLRWGFSDYAELRLQGSYITMTDGEETTAGLADLSIGTKVRLFDGWKAVPAISLLANLYVPGGSDSNFLPQEWGGQIGLLFQNQLTPWLSLGYEGDLIWSDNSRPAAFYGVCLGFALSDRLSLAVEEYNNSSAGETECFSEISLGYQISPRVQIDLGTDISLNYPTRYHNLMLGVAWQITK